MEKLRIVILGAGNVAWHLAPALEKAGHEIIAVYSRTENSARELASQLANAKVLTQPDLHDDFADLFIISVPDKALGELLQSTVFPENGLVAHTSGTVPLSVFDTKENIRGAVFYPLQTFSKNTPVSFRNIPICLETADENAMAFLKKVAVGLSEQVYEISSEERQILHVAAVFSCNFTNHLLGISSEILKSNNLNFEMLKPLVEQTIQKAFLQDPFSVQTGPAIRRDENTIQAQLSFLQNEPNYQQLYEMLTRSIQQHS